MLSNFLLFIKTYFIDLIIENYCNFISICIIFEQKQNYRFNKTLLFILIIYK